MNIDNTKSSCGSISSRLDEFMEYKGLNDNQISVNCNISNGLIGKARKKGGALSLDNISRILSVYPELNSGWLLTGRGAMLLTDNMDLQESTPNTSNADSVMDNETIIERIRQIIEYKRISARKFCTEIGVANGFLDKVKDVGISKANKIINTYPDINLEWLITGRGKMLNKINASPEESESYSFANNIKIIDRIKEYIGIKGLTNASFEQKCNLSSGYIGKQIKRNADIGESILFRILEHCPDLSKSWLFFGQGDMLTTQISNNTGSESSSCSPAVHADQTVVQRIKIIADRENIKIYLLEEMIGASRGVLSRAIKNNTDITAKWVSEVVKLYPIYSAEWLLTGKGRMTVSNQEEAKEYVPESSHKPDALTQLIHQIANKDTLILSQHEEIKELMRENAELKQKLLSYESN